jgi:toxin HigB-1
LLERVIREVQRRRLRAIIQHDPRVTKVQLAVSVAYFRHP